MHDALGKELAPFEYKIGREKIREYANAVGLTDAVHFDRAAAEAAGYRDIVAPPMFAVVYAAGAIGPAIFDPEIGINFAMMVHGSQEFVWSEPAVDGDTITTTGSFKDYRETAGMKFYVFETVSRNQDGAEVCRATWTNIVRGG
jgi:acyl dehydratase